jgi:hypothetical protein
MQAAGAECCAPFANVLDVSQVSERTLVQHTGDIHPLALRLEDSGWTSALERSRLVIEALGGQEDPDALDRRAFGSAIQRKLQSSEPTQQHRRTLPRAL